jgi:hypothetical protein
VSWQASFLAMTAALGVPLDDAVAWLDGSQSPDARELDAALRSASKATRTRALALALGAIARDIEALNVARDADRARRGAP